MPWPVELGEFVMGSAEGPEEERPPARVVLDRPFWIGVTEVSNAQFGRFDPGFEPRCYGKRHARDEDQGLSPNDPRQPAVRVSWEQAMSFGRWLTHRTRRTFTRPTEAQWEWACRAGSDEALFYGGVDADFSAWANLADASFTRGHREDGKPITGGVQDLLREGADLADRRWNDGYCVTAPMGSYRPNRWGLFDRHGNAAEWSLSAYMPYPYRTDDGRNAGDTSGEKVVRGGSFLSRPARSHAGYRLGYAYWQRPFNVGFRVVCSGSRSQQTARTDLPRLERTGGTRQTGNMVRTLRASP